MVPELSAYLPPPPDETELQRIRRRMQQRRCLGCGSPDRVPRRHFCAACGERWQYCSRCEQVKPCGEFPRPGVWCRLCRADANRAARGIASREEGRARLLAAARLGGFAKASSKASEAKQIMIWRDKREWTWAEIGRALGITPNAARCRYYYHKRTRLRGKVIRHASKRNQVEER